MARTVTSADLDTVAGSLRDLRDALLTRAEDFGGVLTAAGDARHLLDRCWSGPLPVDVHAHIDAYLDLVGSSDDAAESARDTVDRWATRADELSESMASNEAWLESTVALLEQTGEANNSALIDDRASAQSQLSELSDEWARDCVSHSDELASAIGDLNACAGALFGTVEQRNAVSGQSYFTAMAIWSLKQAMDFATLDPTGKLQNVADDHVDGFLEGEYAPLQYIVVETMHDGDIRVYDDELSSDDWLESTDYTVVRYRLEMAASLAGLSLDEETLDALAAEIVTTALFVTAGSSDRWKDVDDELDPDSAVEEGLGDWAVEVLMNQGAANPTPVTNPIEVDYEPGATPTEADVYIEAWIDAHHASGEDPLWLAVSTVYSFVVPDFAAMNPFSDDFSPFWAAAEVIGIGNPSDEIAGALRAADNLIDGTRDGLRAGENLGDVDKVLDPDVLSGTPDEAAAAGGGLIDDADDLAEGSDEVAEPGDVVEHQTTDEPDVSGDGQEASGDSPAQPADPPADGATLTPDELLTTAEDFLGPGYTEQPPGSGRFVSADGNRQVRMGSSDLGGAHGGGPHANFETLEMNPTTGRMRVVENNHVFIDE